MSAPNFAIPTFISSTSPLSKLPILVDSLSDRRGDDVSFHWHDYVHIWYVLKGTLRHSIDGTAHLQKPGTAAVVLPYMMHAINSCISEDEPVIISLSFDDSFLTGAGIPFFSYDAKHAFFDGRRLPLLKSLKGAAREEADALANAMLAEFGKHEVISFEALRKMLCRFLELVCANEPSCELSESIQYICDRARLITSATRYMSQNSAERLSIDDLCSVAMMSRSRFTSHFKEITGYTFSNYLLAVRLKSAALLLTFSDMSLSDIAEKTGFSDKCHLTRSFAKCYGMSPTEYKRRTRPVGIPLHEAYVDKWQWADSSLTKTSAQPLT